MNFRSIKNYYRLTKPGVLYGNLITTIAGFLLGSAGHIDWGMLTWVTLGTALVIASACVINNYLDQDIDSLMERTKTRPLIAKEASPLGALIFGVVIGILGLTILALLTNRLVLAVGIFGFVVYVWLYGALSKRRSVHGTLVGSLSGATPILAGYVGATGLFDAGAIIVFAILFVWQMPEFYSISIFRKEEYQKAGVPVISVVKGIDQTKKQIFLYTIAFVILSLLLNVYSLTGWVYLVVMLSLGVYWINLAIEGLITKDDKTWARKMFRFSLIVLVVFSSLISVQHLLV